MNRRITFYYTFLLIIATMFTALGNHNNIHATSSFSGLYNATLIGSNLNDNFNAIVNNNLNDTLNILTPFNDDVDDTKPNNLMDCANCVGNDGINPSTTSNDNGGGNDNRDIGGSGSVDNNDSPDETDNGIPGDIGGGGNNDDGGGNENCEVGGGGNVDNHGGNEARDGSGSVNMGK